MACLAYKLMSDDEVQHIAKLLVVVTNGLWIGTLTKSPTRPYYFGYVRECNSGSGEWLGQRRVADVVPSIVCI